MRRVLIVNSLLLLVGIDAGTRSPTAATLNSRGDEEYGAYAK